MTPGLELSRDLVLPADAVTETFAILAKRRAGKSNAAVVMAEEMYRNGLPWVAVDPKGDWWGVRAGGSGRSPGLPVLVFGGNHGDVPLEPSAGRLVADLIVERRLTCVLDVSEMTKADQRRFLVDFADRLYRVNTEPLHVFCEEADEYIPQRVIGENAKLVGAFETLVKRGGFRGIGITLISQRSASLNKDVLTQVETLIAMRTPSPQDRKAILAWVDYHASGAEAVGELPGLADGEAWVFSPQWLRTLTKIRFRRRHTFDSGATPKVGGRPRPPAALAQVDIDSIAAAMAETVERVNAVNPHTLRARIRDLERQLATRPPVERIQAPVEVVVEVPAIPASDLARLERTIGDLRGIANALEEAVRTVGTRLESPTRATPPPAATAPPNPERPSSTAPRGTSGRRLPSPEQEPPDLRSGARRMVEALGRMAPLRLTKSQWGTVAKLKTTGGTWSTYLSDIRRAGYLDESPAGYTLTTAGFAYLGGQPQPMTAAELQDHYRTILRSGAAKMLDALIDAYPDGLAREELGDAAAIATSGGTFSTYLSDLIRNGLAAKVGGRLVASEILMHGATA